MNIFVFTVDIKIVSCIVFLVLALNHFSLHLLHSHCCRWLSFRGKMKLSIYFDFTYHFLHFKMCLCFFSSSFHFSFFLVVSIPFNFICHVLWMQFVQEMIISKKKRIFQMPKKCSRGFLIFIFLVFWPQMSVHFIQSAKHFDAMCWLFRLSVISLVFTSLEF